MARICCFPALPRKSASSWLAASARVQRCRRRAAAGPAIGQALFERDSPIRLVHADIVTMMVGGVRGLLLQMLHPHALQGVLDHSDFRSDMHGRLRRTARFIAVTTFGEASEAEAAIARVNRIHRRVTGTLPDGTPYSATNPQRSRGSMWRRRPASWKAICVMSGPICPVQEQDEYFRQFAVIARALGADPVPPDRREAERSFANCARICSARPEAREIARLVLISAHPDAAGVRRPCWAPRR